MNIAENIVLKYERPVLFVSLEMSAIELVERLMCSVAKVDSNRLRNGRLNSDEKKRLIEATGLLSKAQLFIDDSPTRTVSEIASVARRIIRGKAPLAAIVVDYLQLIQADDPRDPRQEQVATMARRLKAMAREFEIPVVCLAQLNRQAEDTRDHRPRLSHLRESGAIEQDADVVMFVHRKDYYRNDDEDDQENKEGEALIIVAKQRNGPTGDVPLTWLKKYTRFENRAPDRFQDFDQFASPTYME
jgi:replicative DNA helicase